MKRANKLLVGNSEGKRPLGTSRHRWEDNIRMDLNEIGWEVVDWNHWKVLVNKVVNLHNNEGNFDYLSDY
jgi:hypothetical protein